jgi:hypothetical protein
LVGAPVSVTTLAGRGGDPGPFADGVGTSATFSGPYGVAVNAAGTLALVVSAPSAFR